MYVTNAGKWELPTGKWIGQNRSDRRVFLLPEYMKERFCNLIKERTKILQG